jgi:SAM-dependent methyltransferase
VSVFAGYSRYYDLLYKDKDYAAESEWIALLVQKHAPDARSILEIGSGTGLHAAELARRGYEVTGVDMSEGMLESAEARRSELPSDVASRMSFVHGDARTFRTGRKFDAVISLFHVMSYQTSNDDLAASFTTAREHLDDGGIFVFDCWYGPAVIRQWPARTVKEFSDEATHVHRVAEPVVHATRNIVDVNYTVTVTDKTTGTTDVLKETHNMRYLFSPEIELGLEAAGMRLVESRGWLTDDEPDFSTWGACFTGKAGKA